MTIVKPVTAIRSEDLARHPVWTYASRPGISEVLVRPIARIPVANPSGKIFGVKVAFANGSQHWATIANVDGKDARLNQHFLLISFERSGTWFHLARYHDDEYEEQGPEALAEFFELRVDDIFPISYDLTNLAVGAEAALKGIIPREPTERLTRAEAIALAVSS